MIILQQANSAHYLNSDYYLDRDDRLTHHVPNQCKLVLDGYDSTRGVHIMSFRSDNFGFIVEVGPIRGAYAYFRTGKELQKPGDIRPIPDETRRYRVGRVDYWHPRKRLSGKEVVGAAFSWRGSTVTVNCEFAPEKEATTVKEFDMVLGSFRKPDSQK